METRICVTCKILKNPSDFYTVGRHIRKECKECFNSSRKDFYKAAKTHQRNISDTHANCTRCNERKTLDQFNSYPTSKNGKKAMCKICEHKSKKQSEETRKAKPGYLEGKRLLTKRKRLARVYGMTPACYQKMLDSQNGLCAICGNPERAKKQGGDERGFRDLCVDHCHATGKIRELLCCNCNQGIGHFRENIEILNKAIAYLKKHNQS